MHYPHICLIVLILAFFVSAIDFNAETVNINSNSESVATVRNMINSIKTDIPECSAATFVGVQQSCKEISNDDNSKKQMAYSLSRCFLMSLGIDIPDCDYSLKQCFQENDYHPDFVNIFTQFYLHFDSICYFLETKLWQRQTGDLINALSSTSEQTLEKLQSVRQELFSFEKSISDSLSSSLQISQEIKDATLKITDEIKEQNVVASQLSSSLRELLGQSKELKDSTDTILKSQDKIVTAVTSLRDVTMKIKSTITYPAAAKNIAIDLVLWKLLCTFLPFMHPWSFLWFILTVLSAFLAVKPELYEHRYLFMTLGMLGPILFYESRASKSFERLIGWFAPGLRERDMMRDLLITMGNKKRH